MPILDNEEHCKAHFDQTAQEMQARIVRNMRKRNPLEDLGAARGIKNAIAILAFLAFVAFVLYHICGGLH